MTLLRTINENPLYQNKALVGYIQMPNGQRTRPFYIGSQNAFTAPVDGRLFLFVNDADYSDNRGSFSVRINMQ